MNGGRDILKKYTNKGKEIKMKLTEAILRKLAGEDEEEKPLDLSASLCLYREAREGYALAQDGGGQDAGQDGVGA